IVKVTPGPNQEAPRSDAPPAAVPDPAANGTDPAPAAPPATDPPVADQQAPAAGELTPNVAADPNELKPNTPADPTALPPLQQNNERASRGAAARESSCSQSAEAAELAYL